MKSTDQKLINDLREVTEQVSLPPASEKIIAKAMNRIKQMSKQVEEAKDLLRDYRELREEYNGTIADQREVENDRSATLRVLDRLLNGKGAAENPSLVDILAQVKREGIRSKNYIPLDAGELPSVHLSWKIVEPDTYITGPEMTVMEVWRSLKEAGYVYSHQAPNKNHVFEHTETHVCVYVSVEINHGFIISLYSGD